MMIRIRSRLSRPGPDKTSSTIILGRWIHLMMLVLGIGGLEKRTTPTLLHDETKKQRLLLDDDERTGDTALFGGGYIERGQRLVFMCVTIFYSKKEMDSIFFF